MPYTVKACFEAFNKDIVNLDSEQTKTANSSRDWLIGQIHHKCAENILPASYFERDIKFGSFARKTKIRPLDDIDLMICYKGQGGTYHSTEITGVYDIRIPDNVKVLSELRNDDGMLNSRKVVENLKAALKNVPQYQKADIHRNQEAVTLTLSSYEWNFDIVPCFYTTTNFYLIPDGDGRWKPTDPRIDKKRVEDADANIGMVRQIVRTMKYWKNRAWDKEKLSSYAFEQIVLAAIENMEIYDIQRNVYVVLSQLSSAIKRCIPDPKGYQGDLNCLTREERQTYSEIAEKYSAIANDAYIAETFYGNHQKAIDSWRTIFGNDFPQYG